MYASEAASYRKHYFMRLASLRATKAIDATSTFNSIAVAASAMSSARFIMRRHARVMQFAPLFYRSMTFAAMRNTAPVS